MKKNLFILYLAIFVVMIGFGLMLPVLPFYIERLALADESSQSAAYMHVGLLTGMFAAVQFIFAPLWGRWSDRLGRRKPLILVGLGGNVLALLLFGVGTNLTMLYAARALNGLFSAAVLPIAAAYVADSTSDRARAKTMSWLGAATGLGVVAGPGLGGLARHIEFPMSFSIGPCTIDGYSIPFFAAAALSAVSLAIVSKWLPEPICRPGANTENNTARDASRPQSALITSKSTARLLPWLAVAFVGQFSLALFEGTFALHARTTADFGAIEMGYVFMVCGLVMVLAQSLVAGRLLEHRGESTVAPFCLGSMAIGLLLLMRAKIMPVILLETAIFAVGMAILTPAVAVLVTRRSANRQGAGLGLLTSANSLGQAGGPVMGSLLYMQNDHAPYVFAAALLAIAAVATGTALLRRREGAGPEPEHQMNLIQ